MDISQPTEAVKGGLSNDGSLVPAVEKLPKATKYLRVLDRTKVLHGLRTQTYRKTNNCRQVSKC